MYIGGAINKNYGQLGDLDEEEEERIILVVHDIKPPFLDGHIQFTK